MRCALLLLAFLAACAAAAPASDESLVTAGKQRAAQSTTRWEVRDVVHPKLGPIKVAIALNALTMQGKGDKIVSSVYVSCEKAAHAIAIELVNAPSSDYTRGLPPKALPRLSCIGANGAKSDVAAKWEPNELGDVMARGIAPAALRRCASIEILQNVTLPAGWSRDSQAFSVEVAPYGRELDEVFGECGEAMVYAAALPANRAQPPAAAPESTQPPPNLPVNRAQAPAPPPEPAPKQSAPPQAAPVQAAAPARSASPPPAPPAADGGWQRARTVAKGKSNVRASRSLDSAVVTALPPGMPVLVQPGEGDWWGVKPRSGSAFHGYLRRDRFVLE